MNKNQPPTNGRSVAIPGWLMEFSKWGLSAATAIIVMYTKVAGLEKDMSEIKATTGARTETVVANQQRITTVELKQTLSDKVIADSLLRLESVVKEIKQDVKDLQKK